MHPLRDWIPYKLDKKDVALTCRWLYVGNHRFDAPFFEETQQACLAYPQNSSRFATVSTLDGLIELAQTVPALEPTAFIFHVSRCGSTLLSQLLTLNKQRIVLSEVPLLDELLRLRETNPDILVSQQHQALRSAIQLLGKRRSGHETQLFIKLDSWHVHYYSTIRQLYPTVPILLLYREPTAVVASHQNRRGTHAVPGLLPAHLFDLDPSEVSLMNADDYTAQVLAYYFAQFLRIAEQDSQAFLLGYQNDGVAMMENLAQYLILSFDAHEWQSIRERCGYHAKYPNQAFQKDVPPDLVPDYLRFALALYGQLESKKTTFPQKAH